jgi:hypothetical protein
MESSRAIRSPRKPLSGHRLDELLSTKHVKAARHSVQTQHDPMACQLFFDGVRRCVHLETTIHFDPSW